MLPPVAGAKAAVANAVKPHIPIDRTMVLLAFAFAAAWSVTGAMAAHLPRILEAAGATSLQAIAAGALIGPAQVAARIVEASLLSRYHPLLSTPARLPHPSDRRAIVGIAGGGAAGVFAVFHGAGNGILTIARGTLPLAIFGPQNYAYRLGIIGAPARMAQAGAPLAFGLLIDVHGQPRPDRVVGAQSRRAAGAVPAARTAAAKRDERDGGCLNAQQLMPEPGSINRAFNGYPDLRRCDPDPGEHRDQPEHEIRRDRLADELRGEQARRERVDGHGVGDARSATPAPAPAPTG